VEKQKTKVIVCVYCDEPFICAVYGPMELPVMEEIERNLVYTGCEEAISEIDVPDGMRVATLAGYVEEEPGDESVGIWSYRYVELIKNPYEFTTRTAPTDEYGYDEEIPF
jgi:hypothetical protein